MAGETDFVRDKIRLLPDDQKRNRFFRVPFDGRLLVHEQHFLFEQLAVAVLLGNFYLHDVYTGAVAGYQHQQHGGVTVATSAPLFNGCGARPLPVDRSNRIVVLVAWYRAALV